MADLPSFDRARTNSMRISKKCLRLKSSVALIMKKTPKSIVLFILGALLFISHNAVTAAPKSPLPCETFILFIDPQSPYAKEWLPEQKDLQPWTDSSKEAVNSAFCEVQRKAPAFIARACNGKKLKFVLTKPFNEYDIATADSLIRCTPNFIRSDFSTRQITLVHELAHAIDASASLSDSYEWNCLIMPYLQYYRNRYQNFSHDSYALDPRAVRFGLPTFYAAKNTQEALAEYTTYFLECGWCPDVGIKRFIQQKMLAEFAKPDTQHDLLMQACAESERLNWKQVVVIYTKLLRVEPDSIPARVGLAEAWGKLDDVEMTEFNAFTALRMLQNNRAVYADDVKFCQRQIAWCIARHGRSYSDSGLEYKAIEEYNKSLRVLPNFNFAYAQRGRSYYFLKKYKEAIRDYSKALDLGLIEAETYARRGDSFSHLKQYQRAIEDYTKAISLNRRYEWAYGLRSAAYRKLGKYKLATQDKLMVVKLKHQTT